MFCCKLLSILTGQCLPFEFATTTTYVASSVFSVISKPKSPAVSSMEFLSFFYFSNYKFFSYFLFCCHCRLIYFKKNVLN